MRLLSSDEAADRVRTSLGVSRQRGEATGSQDQVLAEYIRQSVYDLATGSNSERLGTYVTGIMNNVRRQLAPLWPRLERRRNRRPSLREQEAEADLDPDPIRRVFEALDDLREIVHLGDGYWAATPTRLVEVHEDAAFVVSGAPTRSARMEVPAPITLNWIARMVRISDLPQAYVADRSKWQSTKAWLGDPPDDLGDWTTGLFAEASAHLKQSASDLTEFEVYRSAANRGRFQAFRWASARDLPRAPQGLALCRAFEGRHFGIRRYWLGTVSRTRAGLHVEAEYALTTANAVRLRYGIDLLERSPTTIRVDELGPAIQLTLVNPLPPEERRLLVSLGEDRSSRLGKFPLQYRLDKAAFAILRPFLEKLGIRLTPA